MIRYDRCHPLKDGIAVLQARHYIDIVISNSAQLCEKSLTLKYMDEKLFSEIVLLIGSKAGRDHLSFQPSTRLERDLNIYRDDAYELLIDYGKKFNVDVSNFMFADYFDGEGYDPFGWIIDLFKMKIEHIPNKVLTIEHLIKGVKAGKLDEEVINS